jgi:hypothetical protein
MRNSKVFYLNGAVKQIFNKNNQFSQQQKIYIAGANQMSVCLNVLLLNFGALGNEASCLFNKLFVCH